ncbi:MAG: hypothetical protein KKH52_02240 [Nanoarchaeota archaeon]|nr:hypothetical protein [Nanoarchaeota archaeon]MBU1974192.1 hypothetical protein [Nanoarchaeota archaeon]
MDNNNVAYKTKSALNQDGEQTNRLMLVLRTPPCEYNQCTMCGFDNNAGKNIRLQNIQRQYQNGIEGEDFSDIRRIDFPTAGSFYNDRELSPESRNYLFSEVSRLPVDSVMVETRVDYLTEEKVRESKSYLREDQSIELAIGLESADDNVRNKVLRKGLSKKSFERFADICRNTDSQLLAYVLIKSPTLSEAEAVEDAVQTADYVYRIANERGIKARVAFKPMFIPEGTELEEQYLNGEYQLPKLWTTVETVKRTAELASYQPNSIFVGMFDEDLSGDRFSSNCDECNSEVVETLKRFNGTQDLSELERLSCECKPEWEQFLGVRICTQE